MTDAVQKHNSRTNEAAERYIASDRSDPFTRNRVYSHIANKVGGAHLEGYDAERSTETRRVTFGSKTIEFQVEVFKNAKRGA